MSPLPAKGTAYTKRKLTMLNQLNSAANEFLAARQVTTDHLRVLMFDALFKMALGLEDGFALLSDLMFQVLNQQKPNVPQKQRNSILIRDPFAARDFRAAGAAAEIPSRVLMLDAFRKMARGLEQELDA